MTISARAQSLIIAEEVGSQTYYDRTEEHWDWPEGVSGPTIGIGFDCGYETVTSCRAAWEGLVSDDMLRAILAGIGKTGEAAHEFVLANRDKVTIPYTIAMQQFITRELPRWEDITAERLPNFKCLSGDSAGALVSLTYNRGPAGYDSTLPRFREMHQIKHAMVGGHWAFIPPMIHSMIRLWPRSQDLRLRRVHEATLFASGLSECKPLGATS